MSQLGTIHRSRFFTWSAALMGALLCAPAWSSSPAADAPWPNKPITLVVPYTPGGTNDNVARLIAQKVSAKAGQPVILDYKPGAGGTIGAQFVAKSKPDGYTLLNASIGNLAIAPQLMPVGFDPFKSFQSIAYVGSGITTFAVRADFPANNLRELVEYAKKHPVSLGTSGIGTPGHMAGEYFQQLTGIRLQHVPYKGSAAAINDAIGGHVDLVIDPLSTTFVRGGKLKALAYFGTDTAPEGVTGLQSVAQQGFKSWDNAFGGSFLWTAPVGIPEPIRQKLTQWVLEAMAEPEVRKALVNVQVHPDPRGAEGTADVVRKMHGVAQSVFGSTQSTEPSVALNNKTAPKAVN